MYIDDEFNKSRIIDTILEISQEREELENDNKLDKAKEMESIYRQFYQGLKLCTGNYKL